MTTKRCNTFWGSHGCNLPEGHDPEQEHPIHQCGFAGYDIDGEPSYELCQSAQYVDEGHVRVRYPDDDGGWSEWDEWALGLFRNDDEPVR